MLLTDSALSLLSFAPVAPRAVLGGEGGGSAANEGEISLETPFSTSSPPASSTFLINQLHPGGPLGGAKY